MLPRPATGRSKSPSSSHGPREARSRARVRTGPDAVPPQAAPRSWGLAGGSPRAAAELRGVPARATGAADGGTPGDCPPAARTVLAGERGDPLWPARVPDRVLPVGDAGGASPAVASQGDARPRDGRHGGWARRGRPGRPPVPHRRDPRRSPRSPSARGRRLLPRDHDGGPLPGSGVELRLRHGQPGAPRGRLLAGALRARPPGPTADPRSSRAHLPPGAPRRGPRDGAHVCSPIVSATNAS